MQGGKEVSAGKGGPEDLGALQHSTFCEASRRTEQPSWGQEYPKKHHAHLDISRLDASALHGGCKKKCVRHATSASSQRSAFVRALGRALSHLEWLWSPAREHYIR